MVEIIKHKKKQEWAKFIERIADELYPDTEKVTLVMDNFKTHIASSIYETSSRKKQSAYGIGLRLSLPQITVAGSIWLK